MIRFSTVKSAKACGGTSKYNETNASQTLLLFIAYHFFNPFNITIIFYLYQMEFLKWFFDKTFRFNEVVTIETSLLTQWDTIIIIMGYHCDVTTITTSEGGTCILKGFLLWLECMFLSVQQMITYHIRSISLKKSIISLIAYFWVLLAYFSLIEILQTILIIINNNTITKWITGGSCVYIRN